MTTKTNLNTLLFSMHAEFGCKFMLKPPCPTSAWFELLDADGNLLLSAQTPLKMQQAMKAFHVGMRAGFNGAACARDIAPALKEIAAMAEAETTDPAARLWGISQLARAALARLNGGAA